MNDSPLATVLVPLRRWWWIVAVTVAVAVVITGSTLPDRSDAGGRTEATSFQATHLLIRNGEATSQLSFELIALLAQQGDLANRVAAATGLDALEVQAVSVIPDPLTETISVTAVRSSPLQAAELASTYANEMVAFLDERTLSTVDNDLQRVTARVEEVQASVDDLQDQIDDAGFEDAEFPLLQAELDSLLQEFSELRTQQRALTDQRDGSAASFVTLEEPSPVPLEEEADLLALPRRPALRFAIALFVAIALGVAGILALDRLDTKIRTRRQAEDAFGLPVLAELPRRGRRHLAKTAVPAFHDPGGVTAEILRALRLSIALAPTWHLSSVARDVNGSVGTKTPVKLDHEPRTIVITSAMTGDGKSTLAANLAISIAEGGKRVLVVDCDFRRPAVGKLLEVDAGLGLRELTRIEERPLSELASPSLAPNVAMVRSGSRGVTPPWFMAEAADLVARCTAMADVVIFDTGPITLTNEASALLPHVDTGILVVRAGKVDGEQARGAVEQLTQVAAHVSGVVLVGSEGPRRYGYGYYRSDDRDDATAFADTPSHAALWSRSSPPADTEVPARGPVGNGGPVRSRQEPR